MLEHDPVVQYRKEGVFVSRTEEMLYPVEYRMSDLCLRDGITWEWFSEGWAFGNGITVHKTQADPEFKTVVHGTDLNLDEFLAEYGAARIADLSLERRHISHESWQQYESRWAPGTCPQEKHVVHLTWMVTTHKLPNFTYDRVRSLIEEGAEPQDANFYQVVDEPGKYLSTPRVMR